MNDMAEMKFEMLGDALMAKADELPPVRRAFVRGFARRHRMMERLYLRYLKENNLEDSPDAMGNFLEWLQNVDWSTLLPLILAIIQLIS